MDIKTTKGTYGKLILLALLFICYSFYCLDSFQGEDSAVYYYNGLLVALKKLPYIDFVEDKIPVSISFWLFLRL